MRRHLLIGLLCMGLGLSASSCFTTKDEGRALRQDIVRVQDKLVKIESDLEQDKKQLTEMIERARLDVEKLEETLNKATRVLSRNSADFGAEMEAVKDKLRELDGSLAEVRHDVEQGSEMLEAANKRVNDFALAAGLDLPVDQAAIPAQPGAHLEKIRESYNGSRFGEARSLAQAYLDRYPKDDDADDVQLIYAKSYLEQKRWAKGLGILRQFTEKYPKSELNAEVLYEMARAFYALGDCTDARVLVDAVKTRHKDSPFAEKALILSEQMKKNKTQCTS